MPFTRRTALTVPVVSVALAACSAFAQTNTTALSGTITDASGAKIPGATITITNMANSEVKTLPSKSAGEYDFVQLVPGHYKVTVQREGFTTQEAELDLLVATPQTLNFKLEVGSSQVVTVEAPVVSTTLNQSDATLGKAFDNTQVQTLPYLANNVLSLLALQPGVVSLDSGSQNGGLNTDTRAGIINGARQDQTNITLDGTDNNDTNFGYAFNGVLRATRDSVEEFRVTTSGGNADAGRSSGGQVSLQTKSGTNHIHGSGYYYYRDPAMASNNWFTKQGQLNSTLPNVAVKVLQHTYGGSLGFPLLKDKLFFFGAYEGFKQASDQSATLTVPLGTGSAADYGNVAGLRNGTVAYTNVNGGTTVLTPSQIAAMDTGCKAAGGCTAAGVNAAVMSYFNANYPTANSNGGDNVNTGVYSFVSPAPISLITNIARLDYNINSRQALFVRGNLQSDNKLNAQVTPTSGPSSQVYGNSRGLTGGHIWTIGNNATNNFRYGYVRQDDATRGAGGNYVSFSAVSTPLATANSTVYLQQIHNFVDDFTLIKGRHTIQLGGNDRLVFNNRFLTKYLYQNASVTSADLAVGGILNQNTNLDVNAFATALGVPKASTSFASSYNSAITAATGIIGVGSAYANYSVSPTALTALPNGVLPTHQFRSFEQEYYVQDQWKITPKLTVTAGLRYYLLGVPFETKGQQVRPLTSISAFLAARASAAANGTSYNTLVSTGAGGPVNNAPGFWTSQKNNFAPRISFAYAPDNRTSIRGGFQMAYDHFGQGAVNNYNDSYSFGLASTLGKGVQGSVDNDPRFTGPRDVPATILNAAPAGGLFPVTQQGGAGFITQTFNDNLRTPYAETFNFSVQREVVRGLTLTATYTGRLGRHLLMNDDVAMPTDLRDSASGIDYFYAMQQLDKLYDAGTAATAVPTNPYWQNLFPNLTCTVNGVKYTPTQAVYYNMARANETATLQAIDVANAGLNSKCSNNGTPQNRYFHPQYSSLYAESTIGSSNYNSGQLSVRHTLGGSFVYDLNYTFAKSMDLSSAPERGTSTNGLANTIINTFNPSQMYAPSDFDVRHAITADWVATLPFGHGQRWGSNAPRWAEEVLGGWQLTGVLRYSSAFPWSSQVNTSGWGTNWDVRSYAVELAPTPTSGHHHYFAQNTVTSTAKAGVIFPNALDRGPAAYKNFRAAYAGETGERNNLRADGYFSMDPGLAKSFKITEHQSFKLIVEYFNITNAVRYTTPGSGSSSPLEDV